MYKQTVISNLGRIGVSYDDAAHLRRISMTLHRWHELECGDGNDYASWTIERDEKTDKPYMVTYPHTGESRRESIPDRERGALKRLDKIMEHYPDLSAYVQTDPRGASLYIVPNDRLTCDIDRCYTNGTAVYK